MNATLSPSAILMLMMMNQTNFLVQPSEMRKTVMANDVLLQRAARMEKDPAKLVFRRKGTRSLKSKSCRGRPKPRTMV